MRRASWWTAWWEDGPEGVRRLLRERGDANARDADGTTAMFPPASEGDLGLLQELVSAGAHLNAHNDCGETPLHLAVRHGDREAVALLLASGAKPTVRDDEGVTPLHLAARSGDAGLVEILLGHAVDHGRRAGRGGRRRALDLDADGDLDRSGLRWKLNGEDIDLDTRDATGRTPLHYAVEAEGELHYAAEAEGERAGSVEHLLVAVVRHLLAAGADPRLQSNSGDTAMHIAANWCSWPAIAALLGHQAPVDTVDDAGRSPLHVLIENNPPEVDPGLRAIELLIERGADPDGRDKDGLTPLHFAVSSEYAADDIGFVTTLLNAGANPNARTRDGRTPLHCAVEGGDEVGAPVLRALIADGADPNARDGGLGDTALHQVARSGGAEQTKVLIDGGAALNARNGDNWTPLYVAVSEGNSEVAAVLVEAGADPYRRGVDMDMSPVDEALERGAHPDVVTALVGNPNRQDVDGRTPVHHAAADGWGEWLSALIGAGGEPNVQDKEGRTPLHCAASAGEQACMDILLAAGADPTIADKDGAAPAMG